MITSNVLMVFPRFNQNSFWSLSAACKIYGARCPAPPLGLITLAALLPREWNLKLVDRNAESLKPADLAWADVVMTGGMLPQRQDTLKVIDICQVRGKPVMVGGPDAMSSPEAYAHAEFLVLGEAEGIIDRFVDIARHNPAALQAVVIQMVLYLHLGTFAGFVVRELDRQIGGELRPQLSTSAPGASGDALDRIQDVRESQMGG